MEQWELIEAVMGRARRVLLYGRPGTGKTHAATLCRKPGQRVFSVTLTPDTPAAELRGHYVPRGGDFVWMDGPAVTARYRTPGARLVINELHLAGPDVQALLHVILDDDTTSMLTLPTGETLTAAPDTEIVATMNAAPDMLPDALRDRFPVALPVDTPAPGALDALPQDLRSAAFSMVTHDDAERRIGIRAWKGYAELRDTVSEDVAARAIFGPRYTDVMDALTIASAAGPAAGEVTAPRKRR